MSLDLHSLTRHFYTLISNKETVTYFIASESGGFDSGTSIQNVKRRAVKKDLINGELNDIEVDFHIFTDTTSITPKRGDLITDGANKDWVVSIVDVCSIQNRYRCHCWLKRGETYSRDGGLE